MLWALARASGLLQMDADALKPLAQERGLLIVANHPSLLDALMLVAVLPRSACVMKASLMRNPLLGPENNYFSGNFHPSHGAYNVKEAFLETVIPLLNEGIMGYKERPGSNRHDPYLKPGAMANLAAKGLKAYDCDNVSNPTPVPPAGPPDPER